MKKRLLCILSILVVNVISYLAAALTVRNFALGDGAVLDLAPAILVLPAIILQPWFVAFFYLLPVGIVLVPLLTTAVTVLLCAWLNRTAVLERPRRFVSRLGVRQIAAMGAAFFLAVAGVAYARYVDFPTSHHGVPPGIKVAGLNITNSRYFCVSQFIDSEWLWQARISESDFERLVEKHGLHALDPNKLPGVFWRMPPYWWCPSTKNQIKVFSTSSFPVDTRGPEGWFALATWNPDDQLLNVWIKNNL